MTFKNVRMQIRKSFRWIHRELGYLFVALCIIYGISGIALNHRGDWNPDLSITRHSGIIQSNIKLDKASKSDVNKILKTIDIHDDYKKHYYPSPNKLKVFLDVSGGTGSVVIDTENRHYEIEKLQRRFLIYPMNRLHRNTFKQIWTWVSDIFAISLIVFAITGMFMMKGKYGLAKHGIYLVVIGTVVPVVIYWIYT